MTRFQITLGELYELEHRNDYDTDNAIQTDRGITDTGAREEGRGSRPTNNSPQVSDRTGQERH